MSTEQNKSTVRRLIEELNRGNLSIADGLIGPTYVDHNAAPHTPGPQGFKETITWFRAAFPDLHWTVEDVIGEGDRVVLRVIARGTHQGTMMDIAPTHKSVTVNGTAIYRMADGKIAEAWVSRDLLGLLQQIGAVPMPA
jgi:predicted ester cyclase